MSKIKCASRPNMKYLVHLIIWSFIRDILKDIMRVLLDFNVDLIYPLLMFFGEFIFGLIIYLYQKKYFFNKNDNTTSRFMGIELISNYNSLKLRDNKYKIFSLIFFASFFDFIQFIMTIELENTFKNCSSSIDERLSGFLIIFDAIIYRYVLKLRIFRHQIFSIIIIGICLIITIATEYGFQSVNLSLTYGKFTLFIFFHCILQFFNSLLDIIEKYLFEYDYYSPFRILLLEGILGLLFSFFYCVYKNPIPDLKKYFNIQQSYKVALIIISFIIYVILSGLRNSFRVVINKIYSPMESTLSEYILNPLYLIFSLLLTKDFNSNATVKYIYFSINLFLSIIISFSACVYNEFIILFFCKLQHETYQQISFRADSKFNSSGQILAAEDDDTEFEMNNV